MQMNIGIGDAGRKETAAALAKVLADTYALAIKTQNFHWNVTGITFEALHTMFERQYNELAEAVDTLAERIRALGIPALGSMTEFLKHTSIKEDAGALTPPDTMVERLVAGHETAIRTIRAAVSPADKAGDIGTVDLLTQRLEAHEKAAWMLRSVLHQDTENVRQIDSSDHDNGRLREDREETRRVASR